ncbi:MAG: GNAT family N-acetyltransferase [Chitinophagaceae bacterium]
MLIRKAIPADSAALIALTALTPMKGKISLRIDRKPDFFRLLQERGAHIVLVAEDDQHQITGSFSAARQNFVINNRIQPVYYLGDLKVHPDHCKSTVAYRLVKAMQQEMIASGIDLVICTAADGNTSVAPFFEGRSGIPAFQKTSVFNVHQVLPKPFAADAHVRTYGNAAELSSFYTQYFRRYNLYPAISHLEDCIHFCYEENGKMAAAISLFNPAAFKQNVLIDYPFSISVVLQLMRSLKLFLPLPSFPSKGDELRLLYVKYSGFGEGREYAFLKLLEAARDYAFRQRFHFVTIAADEKDVQVNKLLQPFSKFNFRSLHLIASLQKNDQLIRQIADNIAYEDYSLI